jgi:hypothetical protein
MVDFGSVDSPGTVKALNKLAEELESERNSSEFERNSLGPASVPQTAAERRLLWLIRDLVSQHCFDMPKDRKLAYGDPVPVFSQFIAINATAIALLNEYGLVTDFTDNEGRVVGGTLLTQEQTAQVLKTGPFAESIK